MKGDTSHDPEPVAGLNEFPGIPLEYVQVLRSRGIVQAARLLEATRTAEHLGRLAADTGIPAGRLEEIRGLCELTRVPTVGPVLSRVLYYSGIRSVRALAAESQESLRKKLAGVGKTYPEAAASLGDEELLRCLQQAGAIIDGNRGGEQA